MRKEKIITLEDRGRKLTFKIRKMSALKLESWIIRAGLLLAGTGILSREIVDGAAPDSSIRDAAPDAGEAMRKAGKAIMTHGLAAFGAVDYEKARPLLDELLECCARVDAGVEQTLAPGVADGIIEDVRTLFTLRKEALALNLGFFVPAGPSGSDSGTTSRPDLSNPGISVRSRA